jgi:two-component system, NarL family, sensor histidine kinase UhpB
MADTEGAFFGATGDGEAEMMAAPRERRKAIRWSADAIRAREQAREEERCRLARELHDDLGQALTGLTMDLAWLERQVTARPQDGSGNGDDLHHKIQVMSQVVNQCIHTLRSVITELRPQTLDQLGLISSLEWQIETFGRRYGIRTSFVSEIDDVPLDMGRATAVFRMFQEMLTNIARHAHASRVDVRVGLERTALTVTVRDNGRGVNRDALSSGGARRAHSKSSTGLLGMRERAALLGGDVEIDSQSHQGTTVVVRVPIGNRRGVARVKDGRGRS